MVSLASLWLPILLAAVFVFIVSSLIHMVLGYHKNDYRAVPNEDEALDALRKLNLAPGGNYIVPKPGPKGMKDPDFQEKMKKGPLTAVTVMSGTPMGTRLLLWFLYCVVVNVFAAYVASRALHRGADYLDVFRFAGTTAFAGYSLALLQNAIWWDRGWSSTIKSMFDGLIFALITAGTFGWLWPK